MGYSSELRCPEPIFFYPIGWSQEAFEKCILQTVNRKEIRGHHQFDNFAETGKSGLVESKDNLFYTFEYVPETGAVVFGPYDMEFYSKHYVDVVLTKILELLVPKGQRTWLEFVGEDGARWGWAIGHKEIMEISYEEYIYSCTGKISVSEWVDGGKKASLPEQEKQYRKLTIPKGGNRG